VGPGPVIILVAAVALVYALLRHFSRSQPAARRGAARAPELLRRLLETAFVAGLICLLGLLGAGAGHALAPGTPLTDLHLGALRDDVIAGQRPHGLVESAYFTDGQPSRSQQAAGGRQVPGAGRRRGRLLRTGEASRATGPRGGDLGPARGAARRGRPAPGPMDGEADAQRAAGGRVPLPVRPRSTSGGVGARGMPADPSRGRRPPVHF
jgi:hypothetical protein